MVPSFLIDQTMRVFVKKSKSVQHNAVSAITAAIQSSPRETVYKELGLKTVKPRGWLKKNVLFP